MLAHFLHESKRNPRYVSKTKTTNGVGFLCCFKGNTVDIHLSRASNVTVLPNCVQALAFCLLVTAKRRDRGHQSTFPQCYTIAYSLVFPLWKSRIATALRFGMSEPNHRCETRKTFRTRIRRNQCRLLTKELANLENQTNSDILSGSELKPAFEVTVQMLVQARS